MKIVGVAYTNPSNFTHYFDRSVCSVYMVTELDSKFQRFLYSDDFRIRVLFFTDKKLYFRFLEKVKDHDMDKVFVLLFSYYQDLKEEEIEILDVEKVKGDSKVSYIKDYQEIKKRISLILNDLLGLTFI